MKYILIAIILFTIACSETSNNKDMNEFLNVYKDVVIERESFNNTEIANKKVDSVLEANGYTEKEFREKFMKYANNKELNFTQKLDSIRKKVIGNIQKLDSLEKINKDSLEVKSDSDSTANSNK